MLQTDEFVFFYGKQDYLSNFYPTMFQVDNIQFICGEQYIMYMKAKLFADHKTAAFILKETVPSKMKALGRQVQNYDDQRWSRLRENIAYIGLLEKYKQNLDLKTLILATGDKEIVEASPNDRVWGIGMGASHPQVQNRSEWKGMNLLGKILVRVRNQLRCECES